MGTKVPSSCPNKEEEKETTRAKIKMVLIFDTRPVTMGIEQILKLKNEKVVPTLAAYG